LPKNEEKKSWYTPNGESRPRKKKKDPRKKKRRWDEYASTNNTTIPTFLFQLVQLDSSLLLIQKKHCAEAIDLTGLFLKTLGRLTRVVAHNFDVLV
jgi:hypothetical protein